MLTFWFMRLRECHLAWREKLSLFNESLWDEEIILRYTAESDVMAHNLNDKGPSWLDWEMLPKGENGSWREEQSNLRNCQRRQQTLLSGRSRALLGLYSSVRPMPHFHLQNSQTLQSNSGSNSVCGRSYCSNGKWIQVCIFLDGFPRHHDLLSTPGWVVSPVKVSWSRLHLNFLDQFLIYLPNQNYKCYFSGI